MRHRSEQYMVWLDKIKTILKDTFTTVPWETTENSSGSTTTTKKARISSIAVAIILYIGFMCINLDTFSLVSVIIGIIAFSIAAMLWKSSRLKLFKFERIKGAHLLLAFGVFILVGLIDLLLLSMLGTGKTTNDQAIDQSIQLRSTIWFVILGTFIGPFVEEVVYRGMGLKYMFRGLPWVGVIVLSTIFALTHVPSNVIEFLIYFQSAVLYSFVYLKTKRFELPLLMHMLNNAYTFIPLLFQ